MAGYDPFTQPEFEYSPASVGGLGGAGKAGGGLMALMGLGGGALGGFLRGRQEARSNKQDYEKQIALDRALNPNRTLNEALKQNIRGNFLANLGLQGEGGNPYAAFMQSVRGGINPQLMAEYQNMARIPGLQFGGKLVGEDPNSLYNPKGPGFLESLGMGVSKMLGG